MIAIVSASSSVILITCAVVDLCATITGAFSIVPPLSRYAVDLRHLERVAIREGGTSSRHQFA